MESFEDILVEFRQRRISNSRNGSTSTADRYVRHVRNWRDWLDREIGVTVWEAETGDLRDWVHDFERQGLAESTISQRVSAVSKFYQDCSKMAESRRYDMPEVPDNPYDGFSKDDRKKLRGRTKKSQGVADRKGIYYLEPGEIDQLLDNVPSPRLRNELLIKLMFNCGLRRGELAKIKLEHLDRGDRSIFIPARKSERPRVVTYKEGYVGFQLEQWLDYGGRDSMTYAPDSDYLFPTNDSEHISGDFINQIVKKTAKEAGLQEIVSEYSDGRQIHKVTAHTIRHSYAVQAVKSGIDVRTLMQLMGHEDLDTTMVYLKLAEDDVKETSRKFTPKPVSTDD